MLAKFFIFIGDGGNGKGTLLQIIRTILGTRNVTGMGIKELSDERYVPSFKGMLANLGDDIQDQAINDKDMKTLKNISTCDFISTRELYKGAESLYFTGSLIFASNHVLKSWEKGESYKRRVMWLPMYTKVTKKDPLFITKLTTPDAIKYWMKLVIQGYKRLYQNGKFTQSDKVEKFNEMYHRENNPALDFIDGMTAMDFDGIPIKDVYDQYEDWCEDNAVKFNRNLLSDVVTDAFQLDKRVMKVNGKSTRCFVNKK
jgi:putative DNA primase/helicase